jgi:Transposase, Mutator family
LLEVFFSCRGRLAQHEEARIEIVELVLHDFRGVPQCPYSYRTASRSPFDSMPLNLPDADPSSHTSSPCACALRKVPRFSARSFMSAKKTGTRMSTCMVDVIIPPTIGAAIGFITSEPTYPGVVKRLGQDLPELLSFYRFPRHLWRKLRTTNVIERCFVEVRRRTRPMVCFVNVESVDRIIYSIFHRFNLDWRTSTLRLFTQAA